MTNRERVATTDPVHEIAKTPVTHTVPEHIRWSAQRAVELGKVNAMRSQSWPNWRVVTDVEKDTYDISEEEIEVRKRFSDLFGHLQKRIFYKGGDSMLVPDFLGKAEHGITTKVRCIYQKTKYANIEEIGVVQFGEETPIILEEQPVLAVIRAQDIGPGSIDTSHTFRIGITSGLVRFPDYPESPVDAVYYIPLTDLHGYELNQ